MAKLTTADVPKLPGYLTLPEIAEELRMSVQGVSHMALRQQVFTTLCRVGARTLLVSTAEIEAIKKERQDSFEW